MAWLLGILLGWLLQGLGFTGIIWWIGQTSTEGIGAG